MEPLSRVLESYNSPVVLGDFETEESAKTALRKSATLNEYFNIYEEVPGWYFGGSPFGDKSTGRIDFVLSPKRCVINLGWASGFIGVEVKKTGHKAGPLICQMIDYSKAIFELPSAAGCVRVCLSGTCCFPHINPSGVLASVMSSHRLGVILIDRFSTKIQINSTNIFSETNGVAKAKVTNCGLKNGSR